MSSGNIYSSASVSISNSNLSTQIVGVGAVPIRHRKVAVVGSNTPLALHVLKLLQQNTNLTTIKLVLFGEENIIFKEVEKTENLEIREIDEPSELRDCLEDIGAVLLCFNFIKELNIRKEIKVIDIARQTNVNHLVRVSGAYAEDIDIDLTKLHRTIERYIIDTECFTYTFLHPNFTFQNIFNFNPNWSDDHSFSFPFLPDSKISFVDIRDVAEVVVSAIINEHQDHSDQIYTLTGREALSMNEIVAALSVKMGVDIKYIQRDIETAKENWRNIGMSDDSIHQFAELCHLIDQHKCENISDDMEASIGREPTLFTEYLNTLPLNISSSSSSSQNKSDFFKNLLKASKEIHYDSDDDGGGGDDRKNNDDNIIMIENNNHHRNNNKKNNEDNNNNKTNNNHHHHHPPPPSPQQQNGNDNNNNNKKNNREIAKSRREALKTKPLWVPDTDTSACMKCGSHFHLLKRRHHCRACGKVFDSACCSNFLKLPCYADRVRVCLDCFDFYR